jgi:hypothetical protein
VVASDVAAKKDFAKGGDPAAPSGCSFNVTREDVDKMTEKAVRVLPRRCPPRRLAAARHIPGVHTQVQCRQREGGV